MSGGAWPDNKTVAADRLVALRLVPVSRETERRLAAYVDLLFTWRKSINLVSHATLASVWTRHVADSAQLRALAPNAKRWLDMGSGAGFPGLVIAIQLAEVSGAAVHCVESDRRKCAFLREAARVTGACAVVHEARVESLGIAATGRIDAVTARAFAPLPLTLELANGWLEQEAVGVFPRGRSAEQQIGALPTPSNYKIELIPSLIDKKAAILRVRIS